MKIQTFEPKRFLSQLPDFFLPVYDQLSVLGFTPVLVGGVVRDYFLTGKIGKDWDVELYHTTVAFNIDQWKQLGKRLASLGRVTYLPFEILRLDVGGHQVELSPPRIEHFLPELQSKGHKNFTAEFDYKLPFEKSVLRRDFTINAMGIRLSSRDGAEFLDPLSGLDHLREGVLVPCGKDFQKDPVRFLRALRFAGKLNFRMGPELTELLRTMGPLDYSAAYLWSEMQKSGDPLTFLEKLLKERDLHPELRLPVDTEFLAKLSELRSNLENPADHNAWVMALCWCGLSWEKWQTYFSLGKDAGARLARWVDASRAFSKIMPESFHGEFEEIKDLPGFGQLFDWYFTTRNLLQKNPELPLLKVIGEHLPHWIHLYQFEAPKDVKHIDPPLRAKYQVWNLCQRL